MLCEVPGLGPTPLASPHRADGGPARKSQKTIVLDKYKELQGGGNMRLDEIQPSAAEQRVKRLKANAKAAKDRANQLKAQAHAGAERLDMQKARQSLAQPQRSPASSTIKPYH